MFHCGQWEDNADGDNNDQVVSIHKPVPKARTPHKTQCIKQIKVIYSFQIKKLKHTGIQF